MRDISFIYMYSILVGTVVLFWTICVVYKVLFQMVYIVYNLAPNAAILELSWVPISTDKVLFILETFASPNDLYVKSVSGIGFYVTVLPGPPASHTCIFLPSIFWDIAWSIVYGYSTYSECDKVLFLKFN